MMPLRVIRPCGIAAADFAARTCHRHVLFSPLTHSGFESLYQKLKRRPCGQRFNFWRRERDSNPRTGINRYTISNRAPSTNSAISASIFDCLATTLAIIAGFRLLSIRFLKKISALSPLSWAHKIPPHDRKEAEYHAGGRRAD